MLGGDQITCSSVFVIKVKTSYGSMRFTVAGSEKAMVIFDEAGKCSKNRYRAGVAWGVFFLSFNSGVVAMYGPPVRTVGWYVSISRLYRFFGLFVTSPSSPARAARSRLLFIHSS